MRGRGAPDPASATGCTAPNTTIRDCAEIQRASLTSVVLSLKCMEIDNVLAFPYLDPRERMILEALRQLYCFEAIDADGKVTAQGRQLVEFPVQPSLARAREGQTAGLPGRCGAHSGHADCEERLCEAGVQEGGREGHRIGNGWRVDEGVVQRQLRPLEGYQDLPERLRAAGPILDKQDVRIDEEDEKVVSTDSMSQRARQALCYGLFGK
ncbi:hypothetical protein EMCRGX_G020513 [Ephydatia muelleri]